MLHAAPPAADWKNEETPQLANPALGEYLDPEVLRAEIRGNRDRQPRRGALTRQYRLNQQTQNGPRGGPDQVGCRPAITRELRAQTCPAALTSRARSTFELRAGSADGAPRHAARATGT